MGATLVGTYDPLLVVLSYVVASAASFVALDLTGRVTVSREYTRLAWLATGSLIMGLGIWGMHFVGMLAFSLPVAVRYDVGIVIVSMVPAIVASGIALFLASRPRMGVQALAGGSAAMGAAIAGMHYVGMAAMRTSATMSYRPAIVLASILIAVVASGAALAIAFRLRSDQTERVVLLRIGAALIMGVAVVGMHYTGMAAAVFTATEAVVPGAGIGGDSALGVGVGGVALLLAAAALLASFADRRASRHGILKMTVTMTAVAAAVALVSVGALYRTAIQWERDRLQEFASRQAAVVGGVAEESASLGLSPDAALRILLDGRQELTRFGRTGRFFLVQERGDEVVFVGGGLGPVGSGDATWAEPMRRALAGETGVMTHVGERGEAVLAAYRPVDAFDLGIVVTVQLAELRAPFIRTGVLAGWLALGLVVLGSIVLARIGNPMVERIEAGAFLDSVLSSFPVPVLVEGPEGTIEMVNEAFQEVFGRSEDDVEGSTLEVCFGGGAGAALLRSLADRARAGERPTGTGELLTADRSSIPVRVSAAAVGDPDDGSVVLVAEDITEIRRSQVALEEAAESAREASAAKSSFLANMSHEIRTPMNGVMGMLELLLDTNLDDYQRDSANMAMTSAEGLLVVLNDLLDFSKIEAGHLELEKIPFDLPKLVNDATRVMITNAVRRGNELIVDVQAETPTTVVGDPGRVRQVLTNLLGNAVKFTEGGEVVVSVHPHPAPNGDGRIEFRVRDTGMGIPDAKLESIFDEFSQADVSVTRTHGGTGLGLAICRRLVTLMGGTLSVESEVGKGSTFGFVVPLPMAPDGAADAALRPVEGLEGRRILVVDDNDTARRIEKKILEGGGAEVDEAPAADVGLEKMKRALEEGRPYDVVVTDSMMPVKDGFGFAADVAAHPELAGTRLLMLTSAGEAEGGEKAREHGIRGYLLKPVPRADLIRAVGQLLGMRGPGEGEERRIITDESLAATRAPARILLVEDNQVNRMIATTMLEKWGHDVDVAENGQVAVDKATEQPYDLILMDVQMPVLDGIEATRRIRGLERGGSVPIVALTAHALAEERARCEEAGMTGFVSKPFKAEALSEAVDRALRGRRERGV